MDGTTKFKSKRAAKQRRHTSSETRASDVEAEGLLPHARRSRLYNLFGQIEREFEQLYADNLAMQEKLEILNDRLEQVTGTEKDADDGMDGAQSIKQSVKKSGSQISQKLKLTYKTSTSKIVSSFRASTSASQVVRDFRGHRDGVWEVTVSRTEPRVIATASADHTACIWWIQTGTCLLQYLGHSGSVNSVRFHPTLDVAVSASGDQTCHIWKANISAPQHVENLKALSSGEDDLDGSEKEYVETVDSSDDRHEPTFIHQAMVELQGHSGVVIAADWMPGGSQVISASWDRTANLYDAETGELITTLTGHDQELTNVCAHTSQKLVVTTSKDTTFRLWDFRDPSMKVNVFQGHTQHVTSAVFAGGDKVISGSDDRTVKVWDLKNMRSPLTTIRTDSAVNRLSVSPHQNLMAIPHDNRHIRLYDLNGVRIGRLPNNKRQGHSRMVCATAWAEDLSETSVVNLFSCGFDRHVFGWHINLLPKE
ncbi:hypothetical protein NP493_257g02017 [Ridgeia piscesae]|uniref:WD repeat-containing protein 37 n=1 Tax=Ridgeia piscesae TaxID=27915 RepID=A0AAD9NYC3_RIDPI|nr:hypothetical protein NP493_257g02017 [Ridgeia piscesae]